MSGAVAKTYKLDASSEGCTGLFFRKRNSDGSFSTDGDGKWPRNGFVFQVRRSSAAARVTSCSGRVFGRLHSSTAETSDSLALRAPQGVEEVPGWVRLVDQADKWLPVSGHGNVYLHEQK